MTAPIQLASGFFLTAGAFFAIGWGLDEAAGSPRPIWLPTNVRFYRKWREKKRSENSKYVHNPREIFVRQAEYCNALGTGIWAIGVELLILSLGMWLTAIIWGIVTPVCYVWAIWRYLAW